MNTKLVIENIPGIEELNDLKAETLAGGDFRFAVSAAEGSVARVVRNVQGTTHTESANFSDNFLRLNDMNGFGENFAVAIHDRRTGENYLQLRGVNNPARDGDLIDLQAAFAEIGFTGDFEYRIRQIPPSTPTAPRNATAPEDRETCFLLC